RVPWLFRKRLVTLRAYRQTTWAILTRPGSFAKELCRPVRICISDAKAFRRMSVRIAVVACMLGALSIAAINVSWMHLWTQRNALGAQDYHAIAVGTVAVPWSIFVLWLLFLLATDLPTFIWKGLNDSPIHLAPVHHYASAPLALMPLLVVPLAVTWAMVLIGADDLYTLCSAVLFDF